MRMIRCVSQFTRTESNTSQTGKELRQLSTRALQDIKDQNMTNNLSNKKCIPLKVKEDTYRSGSELNPKKAPFQKNSLNKENIKLIDDTPLKMITLTSKNRNQGNRKEITNKQQNEMQTLKESFKSVKDNEEVWGKGQQKRRQEDIARLKIYEQEYTDNLKQFQGMKDDFRDVKKKYQAVMLEKSALHQKYGQIFSENEQLTILISSLKSDLYKTTREHSECKKDTEDILYMRQALKKAQTDISILNKENTYLKSVIDNERQIHQEQVQALKFEAKKRAEEQLQNIQEREQKILELEGEVMHLEELLEAKSKDEQNLALKISKVQDQIQRGNEYLNAQNETLHSENRSLSEIIAIHERKIKDLTSKSSENSAMHEQQLLKSREQSQALQSTVSILQARNSALECELSRLRSESCTQRGYYRQKYQKQLEEFNILCKQFRELQSTNSQFIQTNAANTVQMGRLKTQVIMLRAEIEKIINEENAIKASRMLATEEWQEDRQVERAIQQVQKCRGEVGQLRECLSVARSQLESGKQECQGLNRALHCLKQDNLEHIQRQTELRRIVFQKQSQIEAIKSQLHSQVYDIRLLTQRVHQSQLKYQNLVHKYQQELSQWQTQKKLFCHENTELASSQLKQDSYEGLLRQIEILKQQSQQLQRILGEQIERRNDTIRQLIKQKKSLFEQLVEKGYP